MKNPATFIHKGIVCRYQDGGWYMTKDGVEWGWCSGKSPKYPKSYIDERYRGMAAA